MEDCQDYVINMNRQLREDNKELNREINELKNANEELTNDYDRLDGAKRTVTNLLKNSVELNKMYQDVIEKYDQKMMLVEKFHQSIFKNVTWQIFLLIFFMIIQSIFMFNRWIDICLNLIFGFIFCLNVNQFNIKYDNWMMENIQIKENLAKDLEEIKITNENTDCRHTLIDNI